jgi:hypothetical protein
MVQCFVSLGLSKNDRVDDAVDIRSFSPPARDANDPVMLVPNRLTYVLAGCGRDCRPR